MKNRIPFIVIRCSHPNGSLLTCRGIRALIGAVLGLFVAGFLASQCLACGEKPLYAEATYSLEGPEGDWVFGPNQHEVTVCAGTTIYFHAVTRASGAAEPVKNEVDFDLGDEGGQLEDHANYYWNFDYGEYPRDRRDKTEINSPGACPGACPGGVCPVCYPPVFHRFDEVGTYVVRLFVDDRDDDLGEWYGGFHNDTAQPEASSENLARITVHVQDCSAAYIYHVKPDGDDSNDGLSWIEAKQTISNALQTAASTGGEIWVADNHLDENNQPEEHPYEETITLVNGVALYGGFCGNETLRSQRNPRVYETIIDGGENLVVVSAGATSSTTIIDGFTIRNATTGCPASA